jgi:hypothetical protein
VAGAKTPSTRRIAGGLSWAVAAGMVLQAAIGLLAPSVYRDVALIKAAWYGNDIVTMLIGVPLLAGGLLTARRGSTRGELLWYAALGYGAYNYAYYMYGARLSYVFPLFVAMFVACVWALVLAVATADVPALAARFGAKTPVRTVAAYAGLTGIGLTFAWLGQWGAYVFAGTVPSIGEGPFRLVAAMDLSYMVPPLIVGAVLLARRHAWGYLLTAVSVTQGAAYTAVLTVSSVVAGLRGIPGTMEQVPVWGVWTAVGAAAAVALLWRAERGAPFTA